MNHQHGPVCREAVLAHAADANAVVELLDAYARDPMGGGAGLSAPVRQELPRALATRPNVRVLLAELDARPVGVAVCIEGFSTFACKPLLNLHDIAVMPAYRRRGVATALLRAAETLARGLGCCKLTLEVLSNNLPAQATYRRAGFHDYRLDPASGHALFWQKQLGAP